jgi:SHS2 domain-containing protein
MIYFIFILSLEEVAKADVPFEAWGSPVEEMFLEAADATMNIIVADLETIARRAARTLQVEGANMEMLLFEILQELTFYKDAERLLLRLISYPGGQT